MRADSVVRFPSEDQIRAAQHPNSLELRYDVFRAPFDAVNSVLQRYSELPGDAASIEALDPLLPSVDPLLYSTPVELPDSQHSPDLPEILSTRCVFSFLPFERRAADSSAGSMASLHIEAKQDEDLRRFDRLPTPRVSHDQGAFEAKFDPATDRRPTHPPHVLAELDWAAPFLEFYGYDVNVLAARMSDPLWASFLEEAGDSNWNELLNHNGDARWVGPRGTKRKQPEDGELQESPEEETEEGEIEDGEAAEPEEGEIEEEDEEVAAPTPARIKSDGRLAHERIQREKSRHIHTSSAGVQRVELPVDVDQAPMAKGNWMGSRSYARSSGREIVEKWLARTLAKDLLLFLFIPFLTL